MKVTTGDHGFTTDLGVTSGRFSTMIHSEMAQDMRVRSIISSKTLRETIAGIKDPNERETMSRFRYQAEIQAPEGYEEADQHYAWSVPFQTTNDLAAAELWITQYLLTNPSTKRSQAVIVEVTYTPIDA